MGYCKTYVNESKCMYHLKQGLLSASEKTGITKDIIRICTGICNT